MELARRIEEERYLAEAANLAALKMVVVGLGGCGNNTINNLKRAGIDVPTVAVNTDAAVLSKTRADLRILIGEGVVHGRGSAGSPELGRKITEEEIDRILAPLRDKELIILVAGLGGGTGTGGLPAVAEALKSRFKEKLVMGIVTLPFSSEGPARARNAQWGLAQTLDACDMTIVNANDLLKERAGNLPIVQAFREMDRLLVDMIGGIVGLQGIVPQPGLVNLDFSNFSAMIRNSGLGFIGLGEGRRVYDAFKDSLTKNYCEAEIKGAKSGLVYVEGNQTMLTMTDLERIPKEMSEVYGITTLFWGIMPNWRLYEPRVMVVATGVRSPLVERWLEGS